MDTMHTVGMGVLRPEGIVEAGLRDAAGEPQWSPLGRLVAHVTAHGLTRPKLVT